MKIEVLGDKLKDTVEGIFVSLEKGDTKTVPDDIGEKWCARGWAKDLDGNIETGERKPGVSTIEPDVIKQVS